MIGRYKNCFSCFLVLLFFLQTGLAQPRKYERKSIAFVDDLVYVNSTKGLPSNLEVTYRSIVSNQIRMKRFDYNPIPESVLRKFQSKARNRRMSMEELEDLLDETIVPEIIKFLDIKKEMRAQNLVTETQKNSFITQKARESGITAEQLEEVMNSSYLYVPFIDKYDVSVDSEEDQLNLSVSGGLIWYHVISEGQTGLEKIAVVNSRVSASEDTEDQSRDKARNEALKSAASIMGLNLKTRTRELDMFKLLAPIAEVEGGNVKFPLGENEGLKLDQPYFVGEWRMNNQGESKFYKDGFARVGSVADENTNQPYMSSAWAIKKGDWARGMTIMEHPRLGIDLSIKTRVFPVNVDSGLFAGDDITAIFDSYSGFVPGLDVDFNANIANITGVRQSFITVGFTGAIVPVKSYVMYEDVIAKFGIGNLSIFEVIEQRDNVNSVGFYADGHFGYLKKYYLGPLALHWEAKAGVQAFSVTADYEDKVSLMNITFGGRVNLGLEYALNIDTNIGIFAGFNAFPAANAWIVKKDGDEVPVGNQIFNYSWPKISSIGQTYGVYFHYSIPSLSFSPGELVADAM